MSRLWHKRLARPLAHKAVPVGRRRFTSSVSESFDWADPLSAKTLLTDEESAVAQTAERYCQERLAPRVVRTSACPNRRSLTFPC